VKRILITGGAGFIGSNLARILVQEMGHSVTVIDDLFTGDLVNLKGIPVEFVQGNILDRNLVENCMRGKEIIFHLAARNIIVSMRNPREDLEVNILGTFNVLEAALRAGVEKFVYASTSSIYGNPRYLPISEEEPPHFLNFYSVSKYSGESYARVFYESQDLPATVVRYSNVYGYNQTPKNPYCGVIGKFIEAALKNGPIQIHGDGEQTRDFTFVEDACRATILAGMSPKSTGEAYNVGTGVETSINSLARMTIYLAKSGSKIVSLDRRDIDNIRRRVLNIEKTRYHLKFFPSYTLEEGLRKTIEWVGRNATA
jgi:UDP-glucose 4-epimerase